MSGVWVPGLLFAEGDVVEIKHVGKCLVVGMHDLEDGQADRLDRVLVLTELGERIWFPGEAVVDVLLDD